MSIVRRFLHDERGAAAIEYGVVAAGFVHAGE
jgi:Flp pilus assembly pilin Flp